MKKVLIILFVLTSFFMYADNNQKKDIDDKKIIKEKDDKGNIFKIVDLRNLGYHYSNINTVQIDNNKIERRYYNFLETEKNNLQNEADSYRMNYENNKYYNDNDSLYDKNFRNIITEKYISDDPIKITENKIEMKNGVYEKEIYDKSYQKINYKNGFVEGDYYLKVYNDEYKSKVVNGNGRIKIEYNELEEEYEDLSKVSLEGYYTEGELKDNKKEGEWTLYTYINNENNKVGTIYFKDNILEKVKIFKNDKNEEVNSETIFKNNRIYNEKYTLGYTGEEIDYEKIYIKDDKRDYYKKLEINHKTKKVISEYEENFDMKTQIATYKNDKEKIKVIKTGEFKKNDGEFSLYTGDAEFYINDKLIEKIKLKNEQIDEYYYYDLQTAKEVNNKNLIATKGEYKYKGYLLNLYRNSLLKYELEFRKLEEGVFKAGKREGKWTINLNNRISKDYNLFHVYSNDNLIELEDGLHLDKYKYDKNNDIIFIETTDKYSNDKTIQELTNNGYTYIEKKGNRKYVCESKIKYDNIYDECITGTELIYIDDKLISKIIKKNNLLDGEYVLYKDGKEFYRTVIKNGTGYLKYLDDKGNLIEGKIENYFKEGIWKKTIYDRELGKDNIEEYQYVKNEKIYKKTDKINAKYLNKKLIYLSEIDEDNNKSESYLSDDKKTYYLKFKNSDDQIEEYTLKSDTILEQELDYLNNFVENPTQLDNNQDYLNLHYYKSKDDKMLLKGTYSIFHYVDNNLISEINYKDNKLDGKYKINDYNGKLLYETNFKNGTGMYKQYEYDRLVLEGKMIDGSREGEWKLYKESSDKNKNEIDEIKIYRNDKLIQLEKKDKYYRQLYKYDDSENQIYQETTILDYKDIIKVEKNKIYHEKYEKNNLLSVEMIEFNNNDLNPIKVNNIEFNGSDTKKYIKYKNGKVVLIKNYKKIDPLTQEYKDTSEVNDSDIYYNNNIERYNLDGDYIVYDKDEKEIYKTKFKDGTGLLKTYDSNGNLEIIGNIVKNKQDGIWKHYLNNDLIMEEKYEKGLMKSYKKYYLNGKISSEMENDEIKKYYMNGQLYKKEKEIDFSEIFNNVLNLAVNVDEKIIKDENVEESKEEVKNNETELEYYDNGKIKEQIEYKNNNKQVITKEYYYLGTLKKEIIKNENENKQIKEYYENGIEKYTLNYKKNINSFEVNKDAESQTDSEILSKEDSENKLRYVDKEYPDGKFIYNDINGKKIYETTFVDGNGIYKVFTKNGEILKELEYKDGHITKSTFYVPITKERIELDFSSNFFNKELQEELQNLVITEVKENEKKYNETIENEKEFSMLKAFNSDNKLVLEIKYSSKGMTLNYNKKVINIKNPNINEFDKIIENIVKGEKVEFFYQIIGFLIDEENISLKTYYPNKIDAMSVNITKKSIIDTVSQNYENALNIEDYENTNVSLLSIFKDILEIYIKSNINIKDYYSDGKLRNSIQFLPNGILQQLYYDKNGNKIYEDKGKSIIIKDFYDDGTLKYEISSEELSSVFNLKLYDKNGKRLETAEFFEIENIFYNFLHEWLK